MMSYIVFILTGDQEFLRIIQIVILWIRVTSIKEIDGLINHSVALVSHAH